MKGFFQIGLAVVLGAVLLGGAFYYRTAHSTENAVTAEQVAVALVPRVYQDTKDSDNDGLKDWEEELIGLDPDVPDTVETTETIGNTDDEESPEAEEIPDTVTAQFARDFFEDYIGANTFGGGNLTEEQQASLISSSVSSLTHEVADDFLTHADIQTTSEIGLPALREYGNTVGSIVLSNPGAEENELTILNRALANEDTEELQKLEVTLTAYENLVSQVRAIPAPAVLAKQHLDLLNALIAIRNDIDAMYHAFDDPLPALLRIKRYEDDTRGLYQAIDNMRTKFEQTGVIYTQDEPGIFFFSLRP